MRTQSPDVSVVLPAHNSAETLAGAMASVLEQTGPALELIVIDDGSTDDTATVARAFADARVRVLRNPTNLGIAASLNRGIAEARGRFIARMDADDLALPGRLKGQVCFLNSHPGVAVVGMQALVSDGLTAEASEMTDYPTEPEDVAQGLFFGLPMLHPTVMFDRDQIAADDLMYDTSFVVRQERELLIRLSRRCAVANMCVPGLVYRRHAQSITAKRLEQQRSTAARITTAALTSCGLQAPVARVEAITAMSGFAPHAITGRGIAAIDDTAAWLIENRPRFGYLDGHAWEALVHARRDLACRRIDTIDPDSVPVDDLNLTGNVTRRVAV